ncbi:MAG: FKBP-type peptidyl-prolyl cis-trans isomerase [Balneolaceae bacterium]
MKVQNLFALTIAAALLLAAGCNETNEFGGQVEMNNNIDSVSYSLGYFYGSSMVTEGVEEFNISNFVSGFNTAMDELDPELEDSEMQMAIQRLQLELEAQASDRLTGELEENRATGQAFLETNSEQEGVVETESGLQYRVIEEGDGEYPSAESVVRVHYTGTLVDGREFDSSHTRGQPAEFQLNQVIRGWTEGLQLMREGSTYEFFIPASLAYGNNSPQGSIIPPGATLIFEVELLEIVE